MHRFTLLELLVVTAIIGILLTILLPSLAKSKQLAQVAVCASNQKQISTAIFLYASNNDYHVPKPYKAATGGSLTWSWADLLSSYDGRNLTWNEAQGTLSKGAWAYPSYLCPIRKETIGHKNHKTHKSRSSYFLNRYKSNDNRYLGFIGGVPSGANTGPNGERVTYTAAGRTMYEVSNTGESILLTEGNMWMLGRADNGMISHNSLKSQINSNATIRYEHNKNRQNWTMADGSVRSLSFSATTLGEFTFGATSGSVKNSMWDVTR